MKVIDLLNKIANGEIPKKIMINDMLYTHDGVDYKRESDGGYLFDVFLETTTEDFNREVEIIEDSIRKLPKEVRQPNNFEEVVYIAEDLVNKINEIIKAINEMRKDK